MKDPKAVKEEIRRDYARIAEQGASCCGPGSAGGLAQHAGYGAEQLGSVPREAGNARLGRGDPLAPAPLKPRHTFVTCRRTCRSAVRRDIASIGCGK